MPHPKDKGITLCASCNKPIVDEVTIVKSVAGATKTWYYHPTPIDCANAMKLSKNWRNRNPPVDLTYEEEGTETHNRIDTGLHSGYGYKRKFDYSLSVWLRDLEPENNL